MLVRIYLKWATVHYNLPCVISVMMFIFQLLSFIHEYTNMLILKRIFTVLLNSAKVCASYAWNEFDFYYYHSLAILSVFHKWYREVATVTSHTIPSPSSVSSACCWPQWLYLSTVLFTIPQALYHWNTFPHISYMNLSESIFLI